METLLITGLVLAAIMVVYAFIESGIVMSLIIVGATAAIICVAYFVSKNSKNGNSSQAKNLLVKVFAYAMVILSVLLFFYGIISFFIGLASSDSYDSFSGNICSACGGDGSFLGSTCKSCKGWGLGIKSNMIWVVSTWPSLLIALASAVTFVATFMMFEDKLTFINTKRGKSNRTPNIQFNPLFSDVANFIMMLGHYTNKDDFLGSWVSNEPDVAGVWIMRCRITNKSEKIINDLELTVSLYNNEGKGVSEHHVYHAAKIIKSDEVHSLLWTLPCSNAVLARGVLESAKIQTTDGTIWTIDAI